MELSEGHRVMPDGTDLFTRRWTPDGAEKGTVCLLHGVGEHSGRFGRVATFLTDAGYVVAAFDLRGFGRSSGKRGGARFAETLSDIDGIVAEERSRSSSGKMFVYGHSLGGLLALAYALDRRPDLSGVVASAPVLHTTLKEQKAKVLVARALVRFFPKLSIPSGLDDSKLMRDDEVLSDRRRDPLVHDRVTVGLGVDTLDTADRVLRESARFPVPLMLIHGRSDEVNLLSGSEAMASNAPDCTLLVYDDVLHHPHNDPERKRISEDVVAWLDAHL